MSQGRTFQPTRVVIRHPIPNNKSVNVWQETWNGSTWVRRPQPTGADAFGLQEMEIERSVTASVQRIVIEEGT